LTDWPDRADLFFLSSLALPPLPNSPPLSPLSPLPSQDVLIIYAYITTPPSRRVPAFLACYFGVILSDFITFSIGRRTGVSYADVKMPKVLERVQRAVSAAAPTGKTTSFISGFCIRFAMGIRSPLMLLAGASGAVAFWWYAAGTAAGAAGSIAVQVAIAKGVMKV